MFCNIRLFPIGDGRSGTPGGQQSEGGWQKLKSTCQSNNIGPQMMRPSKQHLDENNIQPYPGSHPRFNNRGRRSSGYGKTSSQRGSSLTTGYVNDIIWSTRKQNKKTTGRGQTPSRASKNRTTAPRSPSKTSTQASQEQDRESNLSGTPSGSPAVKGLSDDDMSKKTKAVMDEYLHINDLKVCIKTFVVQELDSMFYNHWLTPFERLALFYNS